MSWFGASLYKELFCLVVNNNGIFVHVIYVKSYVCLDVTCDVAVELPVKFIVVKLTYAFVYVPVAVHDNCP